MQKTDYFKQVKNESINQITDWVKLDQVDPYFFTWFFFNMYLLRSKLLDVKCITLNSLLVLKKSSAQQIHICSIIINHTNLNIVSQNKIAQTQRTSLPFENRIKTNTQVSLLQNINTQNIKQNYKCPIW